MTKSNKKNQSLTKGKYLVKNTILYFFLKSIDFLSSFFLKSKNKPINIKPKKVLLSNIAHLGDVLISTSILPIIKKEFPKVKIGFICSSLSKQIVESHHLIDKIFLVDHWKLNRSNKSGFKKLFRYFFSKRKAIKQIKKEKYDVAIDLYYYFPNTIHLLSKTKIPIRIGYTSGGFANFLTHSLPWKNQDKHISEFHFDLLKLLNIKDFSKGTIKLELPLYISSSKGLNLPKEYIVFHIGAGSDKKMWPIDKWKTLTQKLIKDQNKIVFTGKGYSENYQINEIINYQDSCINLADKLDFSELIGVIKKAKLVVTVDSLVLHLATALDKPTIVIYCGINNHHHWVLKKKNIFPIVKPLSCSPCYLKNGCETMDCLNQIEADDVLKIMESVFEKSN